MKLLLFFKILLAKKQQNSHSNGTGPYQFDQRMDFAMSNEEFFAEVLSVDESRIVVAYDGPVHGEVTLEAISGDGSELLRSGECVGIGRFELANCSPDSDYALHLTAPGAERRLVCRTLPRPATPELRRFLLLADPHVSFKTENRKGRFFAESALLLEEFVHLANQLRPEAVLCVGDLTNAGTNEEYRLCRTILDALALPLLAVPGNHDVLPPGGTELWRKFFGAPEFQRELGRGDRIVGLDTSSGYLSESGAALLRDALDTPGLLIVLSHYLLYPTPDIHRGSNGVIANTAEYAELLEQLACRPHTLLYTGHQNIPVVTSPAGARGIRQWTLPQPCQYPCGHLLARFHAEGVWHTFLPIGSEVLRQWSRTAGDRAAAFYGERQWESVYRRGRCGLLNQVYFF